MTNTTTIEDDVVRVLDTLTSRNLAAMPRDARNLFRLIPVNGFDLALKIVLCVPLGDIARAHGNGGSRLISSDETAAMPDVAAAIALTERAARGKP